MEDFLAVGEFGRGDEHGAPVCVSCDQNTYQINLKMEGFISA